MGRIDTRTFPALAALLLLGACAHVPAPSPAPEPVALKDANGNPIPPRPHVFGRHAWDLQYGEAARQAAAQQGAAPIATVPPAPQAAPAPAVAAAPPPPPVQAPPPRLAAGPQPVAPARPAPVQPAPSSVVPAAAAPVAPPPPPPPVRMAAATPPAPVPASQPTAPARQRGLFTILKDLRKPAPEPVAGGYETARDSKAVQAAAEFAVKQSVFYELKGIYSAKTQVVAGTNYSLCLWVRQKEHEANPLHRRMVAATVFQGLDGHYELSSWQEVNLCHAGS